MEFEHGRSWSYTVLVLGMVTLLLFYYGEPYSIVGVFIGFMSLIFMSAMYFNLYTLYDEVLIYKEEKENKEKEEKSSFN